MTPIVTPEWEQKKGGGGFLGFLGDVIDVIDTPRLCDCVYCERDR